MNTGRWNWIGGHLETAHRRRAEVISGRIRKEIIRLAAVGALLASFKGKLQTLRASDASPISKTDMKSSRTAFCSAAWSSKMPIANTGAVLSVLDGPNCCDPEVQVVWSRFRMIRWYLAFRPGEIQRIF